MKAFRDNLDWDDWIDDELLIGGAREEILVKGMEDKSKIFKCLLDPSSANTSIPINNDEFDRWLRYNGISEILIETGEGEGDDEEIDKPLDAFLNLVKSNIKADCNNDESNGMLFIVFIHDWPISSITEDPMIGSMVFPFHAYKSTLWGCSISSQKNGDVENGGIRRKFFDNELNGDDDDELNDENDLRSNDWDIIIQFDV